MVQTVSTGMAVIGMTLVYVEKDLDYSWRSCKPSVFFVKSIKLKEIKHVK